MKMILLNNNSNFLIILVGLPASGKSTFAFKLKEKLESIFQNNVKIVDPDVIRNEDFPNNFDFKNEPQIREKNIDCVRKHLINGYIVISDDLNYYSSMRHDLKLVADSLNLKFYIVYISTPLKFCLKRNKDRGKPIPNKVIHKIYNKFDNFDKYKWDSPFGTYDLTNSGDCVQYIEVLSNKIALNLKGKKKSKFIDQNKPSPSIREELDLITRRYVGELLKNPKYRNTKKAILEYRILYLKNKSNEELDVNNILEDFKQYLEIKLKI